MLLFFVHLQAPLLAHPFLVTESDADDDVVARNIDPSKLRVQWAFRIAGAIVLAIGVVFLYWVFNPVPRKLSCVHHEFASFAG